MKKFLLIIGLALTVFAAQAQKGSAVLLPLATGDTIVNAGTTSKIITLTGGYNGAAVQVVLNKISGTGAGTIQLQSSLDGVNYVNIGSAYTITNVTTQSQIFYLTSPLANKIKVLGTGSGTEAVQVRVWYRTPVFQNN